MGANKMGMIANMIANLPWFPSCNPLNFYCSNVQVWDDIFVKVLIASEYLVFGVHEKSQYFYWLSAFWLLR
jgi:hypothetical protein